MGNRRPEALVDGYGHNMARRIQSGRCPLDRCYSISWIWILGRLQRMMRWPPNLELGAQPNRTSECLRLSAFNWYEEWDVDIMHLT